MTLLATDPDTARLTNVRHSSLNPGVSTLRVDVSPWKRRLTQAFSAFTLASVMSDPIVYGYYLQSESESSSHEL